MYNYNFTCRHGLLNQQLAILLQYTDTSRMRLSRIPFLAYESYYVWYAALRRQRYLHHFQYTVYLGGKALGTNERIMSCAHVRQNQKQTPQPPKVYNLKERRCSFVPLTRQRNTASISSDTMRPNQAPGARTIGQQLTVG